MLYKDENGNEYEVFTTEDVEAKIEEAKTAAYEEAMNELGDSDLTDKLRATEKELSELKSKNQSMSGNLSGQRGVIEKKEEEVESLRAKVDQLSKDQQEVLSELKGSSVRQKIASLTSDKEIVAKAQEYYTTYFADKAKTEEEIDRYIQDALLLASKGSIKVGSDFYSNSGNTVSFETTPAGKITDSGIELAKAMGISEERLKKHKLL